MIDTEKRSFGFRDKIGYMFGDFGNDFTFIFASTYLMVFYTKVFGIDAAMVGVLFLVSRCVDAFTDIGMGRIADSAKENSKGVLPYGIPDRVSPLREEIPRNAGAVRPAREGVRSAHGARPLFRVHHQQHLL